MSALADSAAEGSRTAVVTQTSNGRAIMARCPVCEIEFRVTTHGTVRFLAFHGPLARRCMGGGAALAVP